MSALYFCNNAEISFGHMSFKYLVISITALNVKMEIYEKLFQYKIKTLCKQYYLKPINYGEILKHLNHFQLINNIF